MYKEEPNNSGASQGFAALGANMGLSKVYVRSSGETAALGGFKRMQVAPSQGYGVHVIQIYVDADGCPVRNEVFRVAKRYKLRVYVVSNSRMNLPQDELFEMVVVNNQFDAADNWIVGKVKETDIVVTADLPLAARSLEKSARVLDPKGRVFSQESIGDALANRELMSYLREMGSITGGPAPFEQRDRSKFLQRLDDIVQALLKAEREVKGI